MSNLTAENDAPECESCEGSGLAWYPHPEDPLFSLAEDCPRCDGWGTRVIPPAAGGAA